jgi:spermidine synthase
MAMPCMPGEEVRTRRAGVPGWLYALFFLSGISGLLYEVVWFRMLGRILGNTAYATATVLAAFMAGLALGSLLTGRAIDRARRPLLRYGLLELGIGLTALLTLALPERLAPAYRAIHDLAGGSRAALTAGQVVIALAVLLLPTALMGATLPTLCAFGGRRHPSFGRCVGTLYALNTLGAVLGVLAGGFILLGTVGETRTVLVGVALNITAALGTFALARGVSGPVAGEPPEARTLPASGGEAAYPDRVRRLVVACFALGGAVALANQVVWARMLVLYQGTSVYAFSALLGVLLAGMAAGSLLGGRLVDRWADLLRPLAYLYLGLGVAALAALGLFGLGGCLKPDLATGEHLGTLLWAPLVFVGPLGFFGGLLFPVAARCYAPGREAAGRSVAHLYAWNTAGCIAGALLGGFVLIPLCGVGASAALLAATAFALGLILLAAAPRRWETAGRFGWRAAACGLLVLAAGDPYYRLLREQMEEQYPGRVVVYEHVEDGAGSTVAFGTSSGALGDKQLWVGGYGMTRLEPATKLMAHLPLWLADDPHQVLIVCFGMGTTLRSASWHEGLEIWPVELVPGVVRCYRHFHPDGPGLLARPNIHLVVDDGRNFLALEPRQYDVITIDPAPPVFSAGTVNLYTAEFFRLCRDHLRPGGVACLWVPPANRSEVRAILRTYVEAFPHVTVWGGPGPEGGSMGFYLIGSQEPIEGVERKVRDGFRNPAVVADLVEWGRECDSPEKVLGLYLADERPLRGLLADAPVITDDRPYTEFPLLRTLRGGSRYYEVLNAPRLRQELQGFKSTR